MPVAASAELKARAVELYRTLGPSEAARMCGVSKSGVVKWAKAAGVSTQSIELSATASAASVARRVRSAAEWREEMTNTLREISMLAASVELRLLSGRGKHTPELSKATQARMKAVSDLLLITGEATSRVGLQGDAQEHASDIARLRDELAERRKLKAV